MPLNAFKQGVNLFSWQWVVLVLVVGRCFFRGGVSGGKFSKNEQMFVKIKTEHHTKFTKLIFEFAYEKPPGGGVF